MRGAITVGVYYSRALLTGGSIKCMMGWAQRRIETKRPRGVDEGRVIVWARGVAGRLERRVWVRR